VGLEWNERGDPSRNASAARIRKEIDDSLRRLRTDYVDIYQVHWPDPNVPMEETASALAELHKTGKIKAVGVSNFTPPQMLEFLKYSPLHVVQPPYNLFERDAELDVLPFAREHDLTALTYGAICRGLLSGTMTEETTFGADDLRNVDPQFRPPRFVQYLRAVERLDEFARERFGRRVIHLALRWVLDTPGLGVALWGARRPAQLDPIAGVFGFTLDTPTRMEILRIVSDEVVDPVGPEFMAPPEPARA
jgi:aryl-alcohol dehydrogenase-like predicted oxidoreductase